MMRIVALNEETDNDENNEDEIQVTKEAEETIAVSEYMRALSFKQEDRNEDALILLRELLETRVLNEISLEDKNDKLFSVRYNCHKNLALIYEEKGEKELALDHYLQAMDLDDTEVYTMNRLGQLALKLDKMQLADYAFQKCLAKNPNHWPSADGILQVLCNTENILGAYGWALKWYTKDNNYERAIDVLLEITEKFNNLIPFFQSIWKEPFKLPKSKEGRKRKKESVFPQNEIIEKVEYMITPDLEPFKVKELNWLSIGKFITTLYNHLMETKQSIIFIFTVNDMLQPKYDEEVFDVENEEIIEMDVCEEKFLENGLSAENSEQGVEKTPDDSVVFLAPLSADATGSETPKQSDSNAEDSDNAKLETEATKPKPRRRCSDLSYLEQWGWHKNRRYSSRKKSQQDRVETDTTLNGFLRRIMAKYFQENFDNQSPFLADIKAEADSSCRQLKINDTNNDVEVTYEMFQNETEQDFQQFLAELKSQNFDLILIMFLWLKYTSKFWEQSITDEMKDLYHEIYGFYLNHYDLCTWNQLSNEEFNASFRMTLLFMEFDHEKSLIKSKGQTKNEIDAQWKMLFHHLMFNSGNAFVISDDMYEKNIIRLIWLDYCSAKYENDLSKQVECLLYLEHLIGKQDTGFNIKYPNLCENNFLNIDSVRNTRVTLQRKISLNNVKNLYDNHAFVDLVEILKDSLVNSTEIKNSDNTLMKIQTQFEVLLESFWNLGKFQDCLIWAERCLKHAVDNLVAAPTDTYRYREWAESVNFILIYIEELILHESYDILCNLEKYQSRLVQSLSKIVTSQLDAPFDKNNNPSHPVNAKRPWIILHQVLQRDEDNSPVVIKVRNPEALPEVEDIEELLPHTLLLLFTAHEFLGRRQWCTRDNGQLLLYTLDVVAPKVRAPFMDAYRDHVSEYLEQITYCLYGYPPKKARSRHIEEHDANPVDLTWKRAIQLFDIYRPENLPELNSYKVESISADMEQLLLKIIPLIPKDIDPSEQSSNIRDFISGKTEELPQECCLLPHRISCIYYLLADYYFKNRDFSKTIKFYVLDLTCEPTRFDSWAGLALSKATKLETKLNSCTSMDPKEFLIQSEDAIRCYKQCIKLNREHTLVWIEYGSFAYTIHSFCSRNLKHCSDTLSMEMFSYIETRKEQYLRTSYECFSTIEKNNNLQMDDPVTEESDSHDEKWLHHYMLGKIAEKRKEHPKVYLNHYLQAANYLYENNATYPIKINHNNPSNLSIEAVEVFYRTSSAIIKYMEQHVQINRDVGRLFTQVLKDLSTSPFAYNQAKIDDSSINALKRKLAEKAESSTNKQPRFDLVESSPNIMTIEEKFPEPMEVPKVESTTDDTRGSRSGSPTPTTSRSHHGSPSRRRSQESAITTITSTTGTGSSDGSGSSSSESDSSSSDSSSSDSDSSSSDDDAENTDDNTALSESELEPFYRSCVRNLEECVTRFSEHYKSIYRLVHHYLHAPGRLKNLDMCKQLLLGSYKTNLGNQIVGLFSDRKNNNFFNGIWRIPSSEIDRPGSFSSHLVKCVMLLLEVLKECSDHNLLLELALQLHRAPDNDKRYIKESERKELCQQAISFCVQTMRDTLKLQTEKRNDPELLKLIVDIYKAYKNCIKHMNQKELLFTQVLIDAYRYYIQDKVQKMPENQNMFDLAVKLCLQEISIRKNQEKQAMAAAQAVNAPIAMDTSVPLTSKPVSNIPVTTMATTKPTTIPGITSRPRGRPVGSKNSNTAANQAASASMAQLLDPTSMATLMSLYGNPNLAAGIGKDPTYFKTLVQEYYKILGGSSLSPLLANLTSPILNQMKPPSTKPPIPTTSTSGNNQIPKVPQFDIKNLIASAASQVAKSTTVTQSSATISVGSGQLTITPTTSKSTVTSSSKDSKSARTTPLSSQIFQSSIDTPNSISLTKVPISSPIPQHKPESCAMSSLSQLSILPDLPKSLTITPAPSYPTDKLNKLQSHTPQVSLLPEKAKSSIKQESMKYAPKSKPAKKPTINPSPYSRTQSPSTSQSFPGTSASQLNSLAALAQQMPFMNNFNLQNYNSQVNLLNSYADFFKTMGMSSNPNLLSQMAQFQMPTPTQKRPYNKKPRAPKSQQGRFPPPMSVQSRVPDSITAIPIPPQPILKPKSQPFVPPFNLPLSKSPILAHSPNQSPGLAPVAAALAHQSVTPPLVIQSSPTKTLQQKLAERQKANALNESSSNRSSSGQGGKKRDVDVIILD